MIGLTRRQQETVDFIKSYESSCGIMPSFDEIAVGLGWKSKSQVYAMMVSLEERGVVRRLERRGRAIELVEPANMRAVLLSGEIHTTLKTYAASQHISMDTAANELLRQALGLDH